MLGFGQGPPEPGLSLCVGAQIVGKVKLEVEYIPFKAGAEAKAAMGRRLSRRMSRSKINADHKGVLTVHLVKATNLAVRPLVPLAQTAAAALGALAVALCASRGRPRAGAGCAAKPETLVHRAPQSQGRSRLPGCCAAHHVCGLASTRAVARSPCSHEHVAVALTVACRWSAFRRCGAGRRRPRRDPAQRACAAQVLPALSKETPARPGWHRPPMTARRTRT